MEIDWYRTGVLAEKLVADQRTDGPKNGRTDGPTERRTLSRTELLSPTLQKYSISLKSEQEISFHKLF